MFCGECGTKNKKGAMFCEECGAKLVQEEKQEKKVVKKVAKKEVIVKEKKPVSKKTKVLITLIVVIVALLGIGYKVGSDLTSPKHIAKEYIDAVINNDTNKLYGYLDIKGDKTFVGKKTFKELLKETNKAKIDDYKITNVEKKAFTAIVKFNYRTKGSYSELTSSLNLAKEKGKKYLIFDNWKVADVSTDAVILKDFEIKVLKGSKVTFAGIKVDKKYLKKTNDDYDFYVLPQVFKYETVVKAVLPNGMEVENKVTPSTYYDSITIKFDKNSLSKKMEKELLKTSKEILTDIYQSAINRTEAAEAVKKYQHDGIDLTTLENSYNELLASLARSTNQLTSIKFKDLSLYSLKLNDDGNFEVEVKADYDYSVEYVNYSNETQTATKSTYGYMNLVLKYEKSKFYLYELDNLKTYFSRY